uniref:Coiled-coil-helix-coiled-coil-helix domain containing 6b n=1 Tax=Monopterus albus TaxID=43700 RepID=A0A3Q3KQC9_MONAL
KLLAGRCKMKDPEPNRPIHYIPSVGLAPYYTETSTETSLKFFIRLACCYLLRFLFCFLFFQAKQLERKEKELAVISSFYKEQLEILEKKNFDNYKEAAEQYHQAATRAEAHIRPRPTASVCTELQAKVFQCYRENPQQTLHCSSLAKQYMTCVQQAKKVGKCCRLCVWVWVGRVHGRIQKIIWIFV